MTYHDCNCIEVLKIVLELTVKVSLKWAFQNIKNLLLHNNLDVGYSQLEFKWSDISGDLSMKEYTLFVY